MASVTMSEYYGIELHGKVNDATHQAVFPKITKTNAPGMALQGCLIILSSLQSDPRSQFFHGIVSGWIKTMLRYHWVQERTSAHCSYSA
jgi:hypothetical protein